MSDRDDEKQRTIRKGDNQSGSSGGKQSGSEDDKGDSRNRVNRDDDADRNPSRGSNQGTGQSGSEDDKGS